MTHRPEGFKQQILRFGLHRNRRFPNNRPRSGGMGVADSGRNAGEGYALMTPALVVMGLALAAPLLLMVLTSLKSQQGLGFAHGWTLAQYGAVLGEASYRALFIRSV